MTPQQGTTGVFTTDRDLVVVSWDAWLATASGISASDARGRQIAELFPDLTDRGMVERLRRVADGGALEVLATAFHGYLLPLPPRNPRSSFDLMRQFVTIAPRRDGSETIGVQVTIEDVTDRLEQDARLAIELQSPDEAVRLRAVKAVSERQDAAVVLAESLGDRSWRVRREAADAMSRDRDERTIATLVAAIRDAHQDLSTLNAALTALKNSRADVVGPLAELLDDERADVRTYASLGLGLLENDRAVPMLLPRLADPDANVRFHALEALGRIGDRSSADAIVSVAETRDFSVAFAALDALTEIGEPSVAARILPLLDDPLLLEAAIGCLGAIGAEEVVAPLVALLERDEASPVTVAAALVRIHARLEDAFGEGAIVSDIVRAASTPTKVSRMIGALRGASDVELPAIATALGWMRGEGIEAALTPLLAHPAIGPLVADALSARGIDAAPEIINAGRDLVGFARRLAAVALRRIGWDVTTPLLVSWLHDDAEVAVAAAGALGAIGDPRAYEPLLDLLGDPLATVRQAAVSALNSIGHPSMPADVRERLRHPAPEVRESAVRIAGYFGYRECFTDLVALTKDPSEMVRRAAVEALADFEDEGSFNAIAIAARNDPNPMVRAAAIRACWALTAPEATALVESMVDDDNLWVRYHAIRTLASRLANEAGPTLKVTSMLLTHARSDAAPPARIAAIEALAKLGVERGVPLIVEDATHPEPDVAAAAMLALGRFPSDEALRMLRVGIRHENQQVRAAALEALGQLHATSLAPAIADVALESADPLTSVAAINALARIGGDHAVDELVELLGERRLRAEVSRALSRMGGDSFAALARGLRHDRAGIRCIVIEILARVRRADASRHLSRALSDADPAVRLAAGQALTRRDLRDVDRAMETLARSDESPTVRMAAAAVLKHE